MAEAVHARRAAAGKKGAEAANRLAPRRPGEGLARVEQVGQEDPVADPLEGRQEGDEDAHGARPVSHQGHRHLFCATARLTPP